MEHAELPIPQCMLLVFAWIMILMWRTVKPPQLLFVIALAPAAFATLLVVLQHYIKPSELDTTITMFACIAAVIVPASLMMRHQLVRLVKFVFPRARVVRRR